MSPNFEDRVVVPLQMAYEENCLRYSSEAGSLEHDHLNTWFKDGSLASVSCDLTVPLTDEQIHAIDTQHDRVFSDGHTYRMVQSLGSAALTVWLCTGEHIDGNAAFDTASTPEEECSFKAVSVARQAEVQLQGGDTMTVGVISRSCEGTIMTPAGERKFEPEVDRATLVTVALSGVPMASLVLQPKLHRLYDERDLSNYDRLGELVDATMLHDPYFAISALLEHAIDAQSIQMKDF
jgi:hypothetical protein